jgi:hypothetical protein
MLTRYAGFVNQAHNLTSRLSVTTKLILCIKLSYHRCPMVSCQRDKNKCNTTSVSMHENLERAWINSIQEMAFTLRDEKDHFRIVELMIQYMYETDYDLREDQSPEAQSIVDLNQVCAQIELYFMGKRYAVHGLADLAVKKFELVCSQRWDTTNFSHAAVHITQNCAEILPEFLEVIVRTNVAHPCLLENQETRCSLIDRYAWALLSFAVELCKDFMRNFSRDFKFSSVKCGCNVVACSSKP